VRLPLRIRLTAWYVALLAVIVAVLAAFVVDRLNTGLTGAVDRTLSGAAAQVARGGSVDATAVSAAQVLDAGRVAAWRGPLARTPLARAPGGPFTRRLAGEEYRIRAVADGDRLVVVAQSLDGVQDASDRVLALILLAGPPALVVAAVGGWWLARKALRPVGQMAREAERIEIDRLDERIAVPRARDELARLATTLNAMLDRLARGVERRERLIADASHELRSPLAAMRAEIDVALDAGEPSLDVLESAREEVDRLARIVEDLLTLARLDAGALAPEPAPVALLDVAREVAERLAPLGVPIDVAGPAAFAAADRRHVRRALANVVDNAVKASAAGPVTIEVWQHGGSAGLTVTDAGPGVPEHERERIFERFARLDAARGRGGSGLGLAIARELVEAAGGTIDVREDSAFVIALPLSGAAAASARAPAPRA
jgi:signal transduction histidine kinase